MAKRIQCSTGFFNWIFNGYALFYVKIFLKCDYVKKNRTGSYFWFSHHMGNLGAWTLFAVFGHPELKSWINNYRKWNCWPLKFDKTLQSYQFSKTGHHLVRLGYTSQKNVQNYWSDYLLRKFSTFWSRSCCSCSCQLSDKTKTVLLGVGGSLVQWNGHPGKIEGTASGDNLFLKSSHSFLPVIFAQLLLLSFVSLINSVAQKCLSQTPWLSKTV